jgi:hypothetical protein
VQGVLGQVFYTAFRKGMIIKLMNRSWKLNPWRLPVSFRRLPVKGGFFRNISITLTLSLVVSISAAAVSVTDFSDVAPLDWHYRAVEYAVTSGLFNGTSETAFSPDEPMTSSMFVTVLGRAAETPDWYGRTKTTPFNDVTQADYFFPYAVWANDNGIVTGVGGNIFNPYGEISREQIAAILFRYAEKFGYNLIYSNKNYDTFTDTASVSYYAANAMR